MNYTIGHVFDDRDIKSCLAVRRCVFIEEMNMPQETLDDLMYKSTLGWLGIETEDDAWMVAVKAGRSL